MLTILVLADSQNQTIPEGYGAHLHTEEESGNKKDVEMQHNEDPVTGVEGKFRWWPGGRCPYRC